MATDASEIPEEGDGEEHDNPEARAELAFFTNEELCDELAKRHDALIVAGHNPDSTYYCHRYGRPLSLRGLKSLIVEAVGRTVRKWEGRDG